MPQFHETRTGVKFFEVQLPQLIKALETVGLGLKTDISVKPVPADMTATVSEHDVVITPEVHHRIMSTLGVVYARLSQPMSYQSTDRELLDRLSSTSRALAGSVTVRKPDVSVWPIEDIRRRIPHLNYEERVALFQSITKDYCTKCGHPLFSDPMENRCRCEEVTHFVRTRGLIESTDNENRLRLIAQLMEGFCKYCGRKLEDGEQCHCENDE